MIVTVTELVHNTLLLLTVATAYCYFLRCVFNHCDHECSNILTYYNSIRDLAAINSSAKPHLQQYAMTECGAENRELDNLNQVLNEISLLLQHVESFSRYFRGKAGDAYMVAMEERKKQAAALEIMKHFPSTRVLPVEITNALAAIEQKKGIPAIGQQQSSKIMQLFCQQYSTMEESFAVGMIEKLY